MAAGHQVIDLTEPENESVHGEGSDICENPNHAHTLTSMRKQLHNKEKAIQQAKADYQQELNAKNATIAERQTRIVNLAERDAGRVAEIARLQEELDALKDRLANRGKRQKRVSYLSLHDEFRTSSRICLKHSPYANKDRHGPRN